ncbi:xanthine dehydrogenase subunit D [Candidatus Poriferisocius sp.]|uniref:xanthine dehydrogenase subunit D n=1 Tax=Candidatus Poriferisocius sp. TaxID=3101276 RepID=UPI003B01231E
MSTTQIVDDTASPRLGDSTQRPDANLKVSGRFAFSSDLSAAGELWAATLRSPHSSARIESIDTSRAEELPGVAVVITGADLPAASSYGIEIRDQPVFATEVVRYHGEPVAAVAAEDPRTARMALDLIDVIYTPLEGVHDPEESLTAEPIHPDGNVFRHLQIRRGDPQVRGAVAVEATYEIGMQDQAFLGTEAGLAVPTADGGLDLYLASQWLASDYQQISECLGLPPERLRLILSGVGGAFGGREDLTMQIHLGLLALKTRRPVRVSYSREESFLAHVHRHPGRVWVRHEADAEGRLVSVQARVLLDGGAYMSTSNSVILNASVFITGPYKVPNATIDGFAVRTNNPSCGAMRGFGSVQACIVHEAQMDRLAAELKLDPAEVRLRNAMAPGDELSIGQEVPYPAPVAELIQACVDHPLPSVLSPDPEDPFAAMPGGYGRTADPEDIRRGVGYGVGIKNLMFSEGFDDFSTADCELVDGVVTIRCAAVEVGQGFVTIAQQIAAETLGTSRVEVAVADSDAGDAGSSSASRQSWMSGGAIQAACLAVRSQFLQDISRQTLTRSEGLIIRDDVVCTLEDQELGSVADLADGKVYRAREEYHHLPTEPLDGQGQGNAFVAFAFAAHRAVVDVDVELGLVRVVEICTAQDVGRILNPVQAIGQIEGGIAQGVGLAVMEELQVDEGRVVNPSFTDYLIPTVLDMPPVEIARLIEQPEPLSPLGAKGIGEPPTISSTAAVIAAIRDACGAALTRVPVRPQDICGV